MTEMNYKLLFLCSLLLKAFLGVLGVLASWREQIPVFESRPSIYA